MRLTIGEKISYPCQGPCLVGSMVNRVIDGAPIAFYQLVVLNDAGGKLLIPTDRVRAVGIRPLLKKSEIPKLLDRLSQPTQSTENSRERARYNLKLLTSGSAFKLAELVESLSELSETKTLSFGEHRTLERAKKLLICEISEVTGESEERAEEQIDKALKTRKGEPGRTRESVPVTLISQTAEKR